MMDHNNEQPDVERPASGAKPALIRWRAVLVILGLAILVLVWIWLLADLDRQRSFLLTVITGLVTALLLLVRIVFFAGLKWRTRLIILAVVIGTVLAVKTLFRIQGVSGDLLPIVGWRSQPPESAVIVSAQPLPTVLGAAGAPAMFVPTTNDFPQFMGPHRDATVSGPILARDWQAQPPQLLWRRAVGPAWSGFAIVGSAAVTQEQRGDSELVVCYDVPTGKLIWSHADAAHYHTTLAGEGPRATPTITSNRVYALGATGILNCLELSTGRLIWTKDIVEEHGSKVPEWGLSGSPLVVENLVIVSAGGGNGRSLVAYDKGSGDLVWRGGSSRVGYSSPVVTTLAGVPQVLIFNQDCIAGHDSQNGALLWSHPWRKDHPHVALPVVTTGDRVLVSSGYGNGSELLQISRGSDGELSVSQVWKSLRLKAKFTNLAQRDGYVYGLDDGILVCLDLADGALKWKEGRYGHGQVILTGDLLLVMAEDGRVVLLEPVPAAHRELTQFQALDGKTWNPPALAGKLLLVRNHKEAACYRLPVLQ